MAIHSDVERPVVQLCIDVTSVDTAIEVGRMGLRAGVDWLELGTPLVAFAGINSFGEFAEAFPDTVTFLDGKVMDASGRYMESAAELGIDLVCLCASATDATFRVAIAAGRTSGVKVVADLYGIDPPVARATELAALGVDYIYLHYGYDQQNETPEGNRTIDQIREIKDAVDVPVGVVTFDPETGVRAVEAGADILLVSHPYLVGDGAEAGLADYVQQVKAAGSRR